MAGMAASTTVLRGSSSGWRRCSLLIGTLLMMPVDATIAQSVWPQIVIPEGINLTDQGGPVNANGTPLQMRGFTSLATPARVAALFRQSLGQPLVDNTIGARRILGRSLGMHYATVHFEPDGTGTRGVIAVTELSAAINSATASRDADQRLLSRLAAGFHILSRTTSDDARRRIEHVVLTNTHSLGLSTKSIKSMLRIDGFTLERETSSPIQPGVGRATASREASMLFFKKADSEAVVVISRDDQGRTAVVLNTITSSKPTR